MISHINFHRLINKFDPLSSVSTFELLGLVADRALYFEDVSFYESAVETWVKQDILLVLLFLRNFFGYLEFGQEKKPWLTREDHLVLFVVHGQLF